MGDGLRPTGTSKQLRAVGDAWDQAAARVASGPRSRGLLVALARRFLEERHDAALGLAPTTLLTPERADAWILFWAAARRVDDSVESEATAVSEWRTALTERRETNFAERCIAHFLRSSERFGSPEELRNLLWRGLDGLEQEARFTRPRPLAEYVRLLHHKSAPAMAILDRLLFPGEEVALLERHAELFAASTQMGDDCRDVKADLARGRVFITVEEFAQHHAAVRTLDAFAGSPAFSDLRRAMCAWTLRRADEFAGGFARKGNRELAGRLSGLWSHALASDQVRPTRAHLRLPVKAPTPAAPVEGMPPPPILSVLERAYSYR